MVEQAISIFGSALAGVAGWFAQVLVYGELTGLYLGAFFLFLIGKFLLTPLFGSAGSDQVKRKKE